MHKKIRSPGKMIVIETISRKDGFTSMITIFQIDSLRILSHFLHQYPSFRVSCGLYFVPHLSTFSRVGT